MESLGGAYEMLRSCETALRRSENKSVAALPADSNERQKMARRLGYETEDLFVRDYTRARETIQDVYQRYSDHVN